MPIRKQLSQAIQNNRLVLAEFLLNVASCENKKSGLLAAL